MTYSKDELQQLINQAKQTGNSQLLGGLTVVNIKDETSYNRKNLGSKVLSSNLQLLLEAYDLDKEDMRTFAVSDIETAPDVTLVSVAKELIRLGEKARYLLKEAKIDLKKQRSFLDTNNYETELLQVAAEIDFWGDV